MIDDELPIDDPDEQAVEEEFKGKTISEHAEQLAGQSEKTIPTTPIKPKAEEPPAPPPPAPPPPAPPAPPQRQNKPKASPGVSMSQPPVKKPSFSSSPDMDRLRNIAKSSGLSTSMDNIGTDDDGMMFDIEVLEEGEDGRPMVHVERGVSAGSEMELRELYAMSDQKIRIIRKYGEAPREPVQARHSPVPMQMNQPVSAPQVAEAHPKPAEPPKYFNVSGVECKLENGKVYQRQWVRLAGADAEAFRLVNDANNKIVPIDGKHIEQKKWVLIQENPDEGE